MLYVAPQVVRNAQREFKLKPSILLKSCDIKYTESTKIELLQIISSQLQ